MSSSGAGPFGAVQKGLLVRAQHRMDDALQPLHGGGVVQHAGGQLLPVDLAVDGGARKGGLDRRRGLALVDPVHHGVGVVDRNPRFLEQAGGGRLSHSDRASEAEQQHTTIL
jgi:hypothetical protein